MSSFNSDTYLKLLGLSSPVAANLEFLERLQFAHLHRVPFENLDIHRGAPILLELDHLFQKIVVQRRGGFCYELNGLLFGLLKSLGYDCWLVSARVYEGPRKYSPFFDHMAIVVQIDGDLYLTDVGFGDFSRRPILLQQNNQTVDQERIYEVDRYYQYYRVKLLQDSGAVPEYIFKLRSYAWQDFQNRSLFHQSNPKSHFQKGPVITKLTEQGRVTLTNQKLILHGETQAIKEQSTFEVLLQRHFGLSWPQLHSSKD